MALACAALALLGLLAHPAPAAAQVVTTFISNTGQPTTFTSPSIQAVAFTTGAGTYELSSVGIYLGPQIEGVDELLPYPSVTIWEDTNGNPGTLLVTMINPFPIQPRAVNSFTAPLTIITLKASTTYWVVTSNSATFTGAGLSVGLTNKTLDTGTAVGWSLGNARFKVDFDHESWTDHNFPLLFEIRGTGGTTATGRPTITGTAQVGQTLTAVTTAIMDGDGLSNVNYMYKWTRGATEIDGATASTYTLVAADRGTRIKVTVSFTDDAGYREALTSVTTATVAAPPPNTPATGAPTITGTPQVGQTLTADTTAIRDDDRLTNVSYMYQWTRVATDNTETNISEATASTYTLVAADRGTAIKVTVSFTDDAGNDETLTSEATAAANTPATGAPTITGTAQVGQTLTADTADIADDDGLPGDNYTYQWIRVDDTTETDISLLATASTYTLVAADQGMTIKVRVSFTDTAGYAEALTSVATATVTAAANTLATGAPTITGTAQVGQTLTADTADIADDDGLPGDNYTYQWIRVDDTTETDISLLATASTYTLVAADQGMTIKVRVSFTDTAGYAEALTSVATATVTAAANTLATGAPTITGTAQVGQTLTADTADIADDDGLPGDNYTYQWIRVDDTTETDISLLATASTYTLVAADQGMTIKVRVSFTDTAGYAEALTSVATATVTAAANTLATGAPTITGTAQVGQTLTADTADIADDDGLPGDNYTYQWIRVDDTTETDISLLATASTYTLVAADQGMTIKVRVSFTDTAGYAEALTSVATATVTAAANTLATGAPTITGTAQVGQTLTADTADIADDDGLPGDNYTYQWIRVDDTTETDISLLATASTYTLVAADQGMTIKVRVSFTDTAGYAEALTSVATATVTAAANTLATGAPTITGTAQVGQTLTADTADIADDDGLPGDNYTYQWIRVDDTTETDISLLATASTYTLVAADQGMTIKVRVSFTDTAGYAEALTSVATATVTAAANTLATGAPTITGTAQVGQTLTADTADIADDDGLPGDNYTYQWIRVDDTTETDISLLATASTYTLVAADQGMTIKVRVSFTDTAGYAEALTSVATATVTAAANTLATGAPTITGTAQVGQTLTADTADIADDDGLPGDNYTYQWIRVDDTTETDISLLATASTYTLVAADQGMTIKVRVSFTDTAGYAEALTSVATATVTAAANTLATGAPTITGTAQVGQTLTADTADIADDDGLPGDNYTYQWIRVDDTTETDISLLATASTYTLVAADQGMTIKVRVSFTDTAGYAEALTSVATATVTAAANTLATGAPTITGTAQVGQTLTADTADIADDDGLPGDNYTYQWIRVDDTTETDISEATASTYTLVAADQGMTIKVRVSFTDTAGYAEALTSVATATVTTTDSTPATGAPTITGTPQVGLTLTAGITAIRDANGLINVRYTYQWIRVDDTTETNISGATASTYTLVAADEGKTIKVTVSFTDNAGNAETLTSEATAAATITLVAPSTVRAWTSRFGRTVATHVTDAVGERLRQSPGEDSQVTVGGYRLPLGRHAADAADPDATEPETTTDRLASLLTGLVGRVLGLAAPQGGDGTDPRVDEPDPRLGQSQPLQLPTIRLRDVLLGSSFRLALGDDDAAPGDLRLTAWGRVAGTQFSGRDGALTLDGNVLTGTVGVDSAWDRWLTGVAVSHSLGGGSFTGDGGGDFDSSTLTSLHPYLRYAFNERVDVWSVLGYGWGDMTLEPGTGGTLETDTTLLMGAFGGRGILLSAPDNAGFQLATRTDAMLTRMTSGAVAGLAATDAEAHRLRLVLEGTREVTWPEGQRVTPTVELGVRHDWGDAETGFGLELGGRVQYADPGHGLTIEVAVRGLLAHEDSDYKEWGASGTIRIDPGPTGQGLSLTLAPTWGAASSGIESLWARQTTAGLAPQGTRSAPTGRLNAEVSYGVAAPFGTGLLTPYVGTVLTDGAARTYRVGTRLELTGGWTTGVTLSLEGQRQEPVGPQPIYQGLQFQAAWGF